MMSHYVVTKLFKLSLVPFFMAIPLHSTILNPNTVTNAQNDPIIWPYYFINSNKSQACQNMS